MDRPEKRRLPRVQVSLPGLITIMEPTQGALPNRYPARIVDLSEEGALIETAIPPTTILSLLEQPRYCRLDINIPGLPQRILGKSAWISPERPAEPLRHAKIGIYFEEASPEQTLQLRTFLADLIRRPETKWR